jgi:hypothetical protein
MLAPAAWLDRSALALLDLRAIALILLLLALWREDALIASMGAVGMLAPPLLSAVELLAGANFPGLAGQVTGAHENAHAGALALLLGAAPLLSGWIVWRLGYDRRALPASILLAWAVLPASLLLSPPPSEDWVSPAAWLGCLAIGVPLLVYWPAHVVLQRIMRPAPPTQRAWIDSPMLASDRFRAVRLRR